jgi:hypothetical protein
MLVCLDQAMEKPYEYCVFGVATEAFWDGQENFVDPGTLFLLVLETMAQNILSRRNKREGLH